MKSYLLGLLKYLFRAKISKLARVTHDSQISATSAVFRFAQIYRSSIGEYSYVGTNSNVVHADVGKFCSIASDVSIGMASHTLSHISTSPIFTECHNGTKTSWVESNINAAETKRCIIGNDVWIGAKVLIKDGVHIGDGAVVGAGSIVTHDVPPYAIVAGVPAKIIRYRFSPEVIATLQRLAWWNWPETLLKQKIKYFQTQQIDQFVLSELDQSISDMHIAKGQDEAWSNSLNSKEGGGLVVLNSRSAAERRAA